MPTPIHAPALRALVLVALAAPAAGCGRGPAGGAGGFTPPPMPVEVAVAERRTVADRFEAIGTIEAVDAVTLVSEIDGIVVSLPFQEGGAIARGGVVARLDDVQLRAEVDRASAVRDQLQASFERVKSVVEQGAGSPQDLDDAAAALKVAEANLEVARARLAKATIAAPFAGRIGARKVSPGTFLRAGDAVADLARLEDIRVSFSAPERYLGSLHTGAPVTIGTSAFPGYGLEGVFEVVEPVLDPGTRSARVLARAANPEAKLRPGMSANVRTVLSERASALTVPSEAVFVEGGQAFVFVVQPDSTVQRTAVTLGTRLPDVVEVLEGLSPGGRVVRAGHQKLYPGARVMPVSSGAPEGAAASGGPAPPAAADSAAGGGR